MNKYKSCPSAEVHIVNSETKETPCGIPATGKSYATDDEKINCKECLDFLSKDLMKIIELNKSGYAGCMPNGNIVDRREFPNAIPIQENSLFGVVKPKKL